MLLIYRNSTFLLILFSLLRRHRSAPHFLDALEIHYDEYHMVSCGTIDQNDDCDGDGIRNHRHHRDSVDLDLFCYQNREKLLKREPLKRIALSFQPKNL